MKQRALSLLLAAILGVLLYVFASFVGAIWSGGDEADRGDDVEIILLKGPIHFDILLPAREAVRAALNRGDPVVEADWVRWIGVGWGSAAFYTSAGRYRDMRVGPILTAVSGDAAVMRLEVFGDIPEDPHPAVFRMRVSEAQFARLLAGISGQLGEAPLAIEGFSATDRFYPAEGRFHLFRTCNVWVSDVLNAAGIEMGAWTPTPYAVRLSLWWFGRQGGQR